MNKYFQSLSQYFSINPLDEIRTHRVKVALESGGLAIVFIGLGWVLLFSYLKIWPIVLIELILMLVGLTALVLLKRNRIRSAVFLLLTGLFSILLGMSVFLDIPSSTTPRVVHLYFLVIAFYAYQLLVNEHKFLRHGIFLLFLCAFIVFSGSNLAIPISYSIPEGVRLIGAWTNSFFAVGLLCLILYIMQSDFALRTKIGGELGKALWGNQFELYYQPQVDEASCVFGAEALIRWNHPVRGVVAPSEFIPLAEKIGLMIPIGYWVLSDACTQLSKWAKKPGMAHLTISVNVSAQQFYEADFVSKVLGMIKYSGVDASLLKLELTESVLIRNVDDVIAKMTALKAAGVGVSLDDFGTGYSSLSYLKRLPLDQLKIDQSFVQDILVDQHDAAIARTIIALGRDLGLKVIAEGVENEDQKQFLLKNGCYAFQGYWFSHPLPINEFDVYLARGLATINANFD